MLCGFVIAAAMGIAFSLSTSTPAPYQGYMPLGIDSFYHAARIMDVVRGGAFIEFDVRGFMPDGDWIAWPWFYDWSLAQMAKIYLAAGGTHAMSLLAHVPTIGFVANLLLVLLCCRALRLNTLVSIAALFVFAALPVSNQLHLAGRIDHHFAELSCVLLVTWLLLRFESQPGRYQAAAFGAALGFSLGINNGLFLLQIPVVAYFGIRWLLDDRVERSAAIALGVAMPVSVLLMSLPSVPFLEGQFTYYLLSWFHLYLAAAAGVAAVMLSWFERTLKHFAVIAVTGLLLSLPLWSFVIEGIGYIGDAAFTPMEIDPPLTMDLMSLMVLYTPLIILALPAIGLLAFGCYKGKPWLALAVITAFGFAMLLSQQRFALFGVPALILPLAVLLNEVRERFVILPAVVAVAGLSWNAAFASSLNTIEAWNPEYLDIYPLLMRLGEECEEANDVVLADPNQGHYVLYHSRCGVYANNATLTQSHIDRRAKAYGWLRGDPAAISQAIPLPTYVLVRRYGGASGAGHPLNDLGMHKLMLSGAEHPALEELATVGTGQGETPLPVARLYKLK